MLIIPSLKVDLIVIFFVVSCYNRYRWVEGFTPPGYITGDVSFCGENVAFALSFFHFDNPYRWYKPKQVIELPILHP